MKKAANITLRVVTALILIFSVFVMIFTIISVNTVGKDADFLGLKPYIISSDSMKDTFEAGDLIITKKADVQSLSPGDIITFSSINPDTYGDIITHKIREITTYEGESAFVTYGTTTGQDDPYPVPFDKVIGKYVFNLPKMGYFFYFLTTPAGYVTVILIPFLLLISIQAVKFFRLVKQYRSEQQAEIDAQKAEIEAERLEAQRTKEELERLKARLAETGNPLPPDTGRGADENADDKNDCIEADGNEGERK